MKKLFVFAIALTTLLFGSCSKDKEETPAPTPTPSELTFTGSFKAVNGGGGGFSQDKDVEFKITNNTDGSATLWMYKTKFAEMMPAIDMEIPGITSELSETTTNLSGTNLIPHLASRPVDKYIITGFTGKISNNNSNLDIEFKCIGHTVTYAGKVKK